MTSTKRCDFVLYLEVKVSCNFYTQITYYEYCSIYSCEIFVASARGEEKI